MRRVEQENAGTRYDFRIRPPKNALDEVWLLLRRAVWAAHGDGCFGIAKAAAYSALVSSVPLLTTIAALLVQANAQSVSRKLAEFLFEVVPPGSEDLVLHVFTTRGAQPGWVFAAATIASVWGASGFMLSLMEGFQAAYRSPHERGFWKQRGVAVALVFASAVPAVGASALLLFAGRIEESLGLGDAYGLTRFVTIFIAVGAMVFVISLLYRFGPQRGADCQDFRRLWPGAMVAAALWLLTTGAFSWYVRNIGSYNVLYGSIGAVIALLVWLYLLCVIALIGCEFNAEGERAKSAGFPSFVF
jgi:membrane protein